MKNPLLDKEFLKELDKIKSKWVYGKIISLDINENPIEELQGRVTSGNVNIDGASAVRRTCSLSIAAGDLNITDFYWGITHKFKLEIGVKNEINSEYPDIIWFPQGVYVITSFNTTYNQNSLNISISGKDKMVFLNGEMGGVFPISTQFDCYDTNATDSNGTNISEAKIPVKTIITNLVTQYGNESMNNIIINDIGDYGLKQVRYEGADESDSVYLLKEADSMTDTIGYYPKVFSLEDMKDVLNVGTNTIQAISGVKYSSTTAYNQSRSTMFKTADGNDFIFDNGVDMIDNNATRIEYDGGYYTVREIQYDTDIGYALTDLIYGDELIGNVGGTVTSILDTIVSAFGEYEYFYNLDGKFVFQQKPTYINTSWNSIVSDYEQNDDGKYVESMMESSSIIYSFEDGNLITNYQNTPNLLNLKNDFTVWGEKNTSNKVPIHMRYAICSKPYYYCNYSGKIFTTEDAPDGFEDDENATYNVDWREIIYQMAVDFQDHNGDDNFFHTIVSNNETRGLYSNGRTGYEQYYTDLLGFWRTIYDGTNWIVDDTTGLTPLEDPENLIFWIDFLDTSGELSKYSVDAIGSRPKAENKTSVKAIHYAEVPNFIFYDMDLYKDDDGSNLKGMSAADLRTIIENQFPSYIPMTLDEDYLTAEMIAISTETQSAKEVIDDYLYNYACCANNITLTCFPIYYLEPNTRIAVQSKETGIEGEYIISKITVPLTYNGTMSITASRAIDRLY